MYVFQPGSIVFLSDLYQHKIKLLGGQCISIAKNIENPWDVAMKEMNISLFTRQLGISRTTSLILRVQS